MRLGPEKTTKNRPPAPQWSAQERKEMDYDEPHLTLNEKMQPIQWTERPTGALVAAGSLWPLLLELGLYPSNWD